MDQFSTKLPESLIVIACSTGGPRALSELIPFLPKEIGCSILIVQHMPVGFTNSLANRLDLLSEINVKEAETEEILEKNVVYIAKGGYQMKIAKTKGDKHIIYFSDEAGKNGLRPCADITLSSLIYTRFNKIIYVVLTGMGSDGLKGIKALKKEKDVYIIAQDEETSTVFGMPKAVIREGLANEIVPLQDIANSIIRNLEVWFLWI